MGIEHVFVLMLENRSFDHLLGFSSIEGTDAETGQATRVNALAGTESNDYAGKTYRVSQGAEFVMPADPAHEFENALEQLAGSGAAYPAGGAYPAVTNSGFVASYMKGGGANPEDVMQCYGPDQLPVLNELASEFVICDNWHA